MTTTPPPWWESVRRTGVAPQDMRVSDADRQSMSDILGQHYADGRLDEAEFQERLHRAMSAKTRKDFSGLTWDLPTTNGQAQPLTTRPSRRHRPWFAYVAIWCLAWMAIATVLSLWAHVASFHFGWLLIAFFAVLILSRRSRHHHRDYGPDNSHHHGRNRKGRDVSNQTWNGPGWNGPGWNRPGWNGPGWNTRNVPPSDYPSSGSFTDDGTWVA